LKYTGDAPLLSNGHIGSKVSASRLAEALRTFEKEQGDDYSLKNRQWASRERVE